MTHDKFCQDNGLGCGEYFCDEPCICEIVANIRADEREQAAQRVREVRHQDECHESENIWDYCECFTHETFAAAARGGEQA